MASPEADALVREYKFRHYKTWPDHQLPALGGKTPREAARTKHGRRKIEVMLKLPEWMKHKHNQSISMSMHKTWRHH